MRWAGHVARVGESRCEFLVGKEPVGKPRHRWEDNIKIDLEVVRIHLIDLPHDWNRKLAVLNAVMSFRVPQNVENFLNR